MPNFLPRFRSAGISDFAASWLTGFAQPTTDAGASAVVPIASTVSMLRLLIPAS